MRYGKTFPAPSKATAERGKALAQPEAPPFPVLLATDFATQLSGTGPESEGSAGTTKAKRADRSTLPCPSADSLGRS